MRVILGIIITLFLCGVSFGVTPQDELHSAIKDLDSLPKEDQEYTRYFSSYAIPEALRQDAENVLNFWVHSLSSNNIFAKPYRIEDSKTLYRIDLRNYNWSAEAWEKMAVQEIYFSEPWVDHKEYNYMRLIAGNAIVRTDFFLAHTSDNMIQVDSDEQNILYYEFLYGNNKPKNITDFLNFWRINIKDIKDLSLEQGTIIDQGESAVARHNRQLKRARTILGYYWLTRDVKNNEKQRDYIENLFPEVVDAGEVIASNKLQLQVYMLINGEGNRIEFADSAVAVDDNDIHSDVRVRTAISCVMCHAQGIIEPGNSLRDILKSGVELKTKDKAFRDKVEAFYFRDILSLVEDDKKLYERAVKECNGLTPQENAAAFKKVLNWYFLPVDLEQAAIETGSTVEQLKEKGKLSTIGRLTALVQGRPIPRDVWESVKNSVFGQAMILLYALDKVEYTPKTVYVKPLVNNTEVKN